MKKLVLLCALCIVFFPAQLTRAAEPTGSISGTVVDPSGAAVPGAKITATNVDTGVTRQTATTGDGSYAFLGLPVGSYSLTVEATGFQRSVQTGITVKADQSLTVPISLILGATTQSVTVEGNTALVQTQQATLSRAISSQEVGNLPLQGRLTAQLATLSPGMVSLGTKTVNEGANASTGTNARGSGDSFQGVTYPGAQAVAGNGARADSVEYNLDGASNQDTYTNVNNPYPNPDAVQEISVQTNSYSAQYGRGAGGVVNVVTKSGTNQLHGTAFDYLRNGALNARNFFNPGRDLLKRNQFGGTLGGPIIHDKAFFFGSYQGTIIRSESFGNSVNLPSQAFASGDFSSLLPGTQLVDPFTGDPIPGNIITPDMMDTAASNLLAKIPLSSTTGGVTVLPRSPVRQGENEAMGRVDYNLSEKNHLYGRYFYTRYTNDPFIGKQNPLQSSSGFVDEDQDIGVSDTYNFTPNLLNIATFSYNRNHSTILPGTPFSLADIGSMVSVTDPPELRLNVSGFFSMSTGAPGEFDRDNYRFTDDVNWVHGKHIVVFGGDFLRPSVVLNNDYKQNPRLTFRSHSGNAFADYLLGYVDNFQQGGGEFGSHRANLASLYAQDNYQIRPNLTLNLGLRWDPFPGYTDSLGRTECFRPGQQSTRFPGAPPGYLFAGDSGCPDSGFDTTWRNFAPRFGFAYSLGSRHSTVIRGGYGMFFQAPFLESFNHMVDSAPFSPQYLFRGVSFTDPYGSKGIENPFPAQYAPKIPSATDAFFPSPLDLAVSFAPDWKPAEMMQWNLTVEHQFAGDILLRGSYVGSKGTHLSYNTDINAPSPSPTATADNEDARRPYQAYGQITMDISGANSTFSAFQLVLQKRFSHGLLLDANYTWSKSIDWASSTSDMDTITVINPYNVRAYRGVSDFNVPHRFILDYVWQLPSAGQGMKNTVLGGWATSGIWTWESGFPLNIDTASDTSFSLPEVGNDQASQICAPQYTGGSPHDRVYPQTPWFQPGCFVVPADNTFGNVGRNTLIGPGVFGIDFAAYKTFSLTERLKLQFRTEFFNVLNHANFLNPDTTVTDDTFGYITGAQSPRILQMSLRLQF
jgi:Carboxypeptidase regulatory-like domain